MIFNIILSILNRVLESLNYNIILDGNPNAFCPFEKHSTNNVLSIVYLQDNNDLREKLLFTFRQSCHGLSITHKQASIILTFALFLRH